MSDFASPAILLRRIDYGDYDLIITFFTLKKGKCTVIAKSAKKSKKRFAGILELFSDLDLVFCSGRGKGLFILKEASLKNPFQCIRSSIAKTAYASYWAELINGWTEEGEKQTELYHVFKFVLDQLDQGVVSDAALSILFQIKFITLSGLGPNLGGCCICKNETEKIKKNNIAFNLAKGSMICEKCCDYQTSGGIELSKGTIKQLQWIERMDLKRAMRVKFTEQSLQEALKFVETFVPYHTGKQLRSLQFLKQIRNT